EELARSIKASGIIQPLVVRPMGSRFQLIAGERRWRAAQRAGLTKVAAIIKQVSDELALEMTLVENIQREDLNAMESARAFQRLATRRASVTNSVMPTQTDANIRAALEELQRHLGTKVLLRQKTKTRPGNLVLEYYDEAQLMGIYDRLMK